MPSRKRADHPGTSSRGCAKRHLEGWPQAQTSRGAMVRPSRASGHRVARLLTMHCEIELSLTAAATTPATSAAAPASAASTTVAPTTVARAASAASTTLAATTPSSARGATAGGWHHVR